MRRLLLNYCIMHSLFSSFFKMIIFFKNLTSNRLFISGFVFILVVVVLVLVALGRMGKLNKVKRRMTKRMSQLRNTWYDLRRMDHTPPKSRNVGHFFYFKCPSTIFRFSCKKQESNQYAFKATRL